nr:hypothetical protein [Micromonospora sp. DSM 115978]
VSMPFWAWQFVTPDGTRFDSAIMARSDSVAIITYRDTVATIHDVAITPSRRAIAANKPFRWAAETNNVQPPNITFFGSTNTQMQAVLDAAERIAVSVALYRGYAIHDYTGWSAMPR